jgi:SAM-dependent methyltransferase
MALSMNSLVKRFLPSAMYPFARDLPYYFKDAGYTSPSGIPIPKLRDQFDGERGYEIFERNGQEAIEFYINTMGMKTSWKILDIGSGIGRKTRPLLNYIDDDGLYVGIDIDDRGVKWCSDNLSPVNNRFVFFTLNVYNSYYNPNGGMRARDIVFPFADDSFDMTVLWSVFTHMHAAEIARYLREIGRVLKVGGKVSASYFVMNEPTKELVQSGQSKLNLVHALDAGKSWTNNPNVPEDAIAVDEGWLRQAYADAGLVVIEPIHAGHWRGSGESSGSGSLNYQDIVIAQKTR